MPMCCIPLEASPLQDASIYETGVSVNLWGHASTYRIPFARKSKLYRSGITRRRELTRMLTKPGSRQACRPFNLEPEAQHEFPDSQGARSPPHQARGVMSNMERPRCETLSDMNQGMLDKQGPRKAPFRR